MPRRADSPPPPTLANYRGSPEFRNFLDQLAEATAAENFCDLIDLGLAMLANHHRIPMPTRTRPVGWNRYTDGPATGEGGVQ
jgi:hypothetical protein